MDSDFTENRCKNASNEIRESQETKIDPMSPLSQEQVRTATPEPLVTELSNRAGEGKSPLATGLSMLSPSLTGIVFFGILNGLFLMNVNDKCDSRMTSYLTEISELESRTIDNELELNILKSRLEVLEFEIFESTKQTRENQQNIHIHRNQPQDEGMASADLENMKKERDDLTAKYEKDRMELIKIHEKEITDLKTASSRKDQEMQKLKAQIASFERQLKSSKLELSRKTKQVEVHEKSVKKLKADLLDTTLDYMILHGENQKNLKNSVINYIRYLQEQGDSELHVWAFYNYLTEIQELVEEDPEVDVNARNKKFMTPLHRSAEGSNLTGSLPVIKYLIENEADVFLKDDKNFTFLHELFNSISNETVPADLHELALFLDEWELTSLFNVPGGAHGHTPFQLLVRQIEVEERTLALLYKNGVYFDALDNFGNIPLAYTIGGKLSLKFMKSLLKFDSAFTWITYANYNNQSLLYIAAEFCNVEALRLFLARGGSELDINGVDAIGNTPLHVAVLGKEDVFETVLFLIQNGANVNILNNAGHSPLAIALSRKDLIDKYNVIELLQNNR